MTTNFTFTKILFIASIFFPQIGYAEPIAISKINGHSVEIRQVDYQKELLLDGRKLLTNGIISFEEMSTVGGVVVFMGWSSSGGNACDASPFILSFPLDKNPQLDGPIENCAAVDYKIESDKITFVTGNISKFVSEHWSWTPAEGLKQLASQPFEADTDQTWNSLRERKIDHPADLLKNKDIYNSLSILVGDRLPELEAILIGTGSGEFKGDDYTGTVCQRHSCGSVEALVFVSAHDRKIYVAWKPENKKIVVFPEVKSWPDKAKGELRTWAGNWK